MPYLNCPQCHASFHSGLLYARNELCPRCGAPFRPSRPSFREHLKSAVLRRGSPDEQAVDWEIITGSQYADRQSVSRQSGDAAPDRDRAQT